MQVEMEILQENGMRHQANALKHMQWNRSANDGTWWNNMQL